MRVCARTHTHTHTHAHTHVYTHTRSHTHVPTQTHVHTRTHTHTHAHTHTLTHVPRQRSLISPFRPPAATSSCSATSKRPAQRDGTPQNSVHQTAGRTHHDLPYHVGRCQPILNKKLCSQHAEEGRGLTSTRSRNKTPRGTRRPRTCGQWRPPRTTPQPACQGGGQRYALQLLTNSQSRPKNENNEAANGANTRQQLRRDGTTSAPPPNDTMMTKTTQKSIE